MAARSKGFAVLWSDLNTARRRLEEDQKREQQVEESLAAATDEMIIKMFRKQFESEDDLIQSLLDLQAGKVKIAFIPADPGDPEDDDFENDRGGDNLFDEEEYGDE